MDYERARSRLRGCYITVPTMFRDPDLGLDLRRSGATSRLLIGRRHRRALRHVPGRRGGGRLLDHDLRRAGRGRGGGGRGRGRPRAGRDGGADDEHARAAPARQGRGGARRRVHPGLLPVLLPHTEEDFYEYVAEAADAADIGIILYNTFWTSAGVSFRLVERLVEIPNVVGLKWACPRTDAMEFEDVVSTFADRLTIIDNHLMFALAGMLGAPRLRGAPLPTTGRNGASG